MTKRVKRYLVFFCKPMKKNSPPEKKRPGRKQKSIAKFPLQKRKMEEALSYLTKKGWSQVQLSREVFGVSDQTFSDWVTGKRKMDLRTIKTFHHDLGIRIEFWEDENLKIEDAIDHEPEKRSLAPPTRFPSFKDAEPHLKQLWDNLGEQFKQKGDSAVLDTREMRSTPASSSGPATSSVEGGDNEGETIKGGGGD